MLKIERKLPPSQIGKKEGSRPRRANAMLGFRAKSPDVAFQRVPQRSGVVAPCREADAAYRFSSAPGRLTRLLRTEYASGLRLGAGFSYNRLNGPVAVCRTSLDLGARSSTLRARLFYSAFQVPAQAR